MAISVRSATSDLISRELSLSFRSRAYIFLFKIKYYNQAIVGERMYLMTFIRVMFMTCVPLFMLLTGYLSSEKEDRNRAEAAS